MNRQVFLQSVLYIDFIMTDCPNKDVQKPQQAQSSFQVGDQTSQVDIAKIRKTKEDSFKKLFGPKTYAKEDSVEAKKTKKSVTIKPLSGKLFIIWFCLKKEWFCDISLSFFQ